MKQIDKITIASLAVSILGLLVALLAGLLNPFAASMAIIGLLLLAWMAWVTAKIVVSGATFKESSQKTIVLRVDSIPDIPYYSSFQDQIVKADSAYRKAKIPPDFLTWPRFTILFWVEITEEFFQSHNNKYLFSYTSDVKDSSGYPNAFFLGVVGRSARWRFVIRGKDPKNSTEINFASAHNLLGWKLFSLRWHRDRRSLDFSIDAGHVFRDTREIPVGFLPEPVPNCEFHLGGWQDNWHGGLSELRYYGFRIYERYLSEGDLETVLSKEKELLKAT